MLFGTRKWEQRLNEEIQSLTRAQGYREVTYDRLKALVEPPNEKLLAEAVSKWILKGTVKVFYRVLSPTKVELKRFDSILDIPDEMLDDSTGEIMEIDRFRNVEAVYVAEKPIEH